MGLAEAPARRPRQERVDRKTMLLELSEYLVLLLGQELIRAIRLHQPHHAKIAPNHLRAHGGQRIVADLAVVWRIPLNVADRADAEIPVAQHGGHGMVVQERECRLCRRDGTVAALDLGSGK